MPTGKMSEVNIREVSMTHPLVDGLMAAVEVLVSDVVFPVTVPERFAVGRRVFVGVEVALSLYWIYHLPLVVSRVS